MLMKIGLGFLGVVAIFLGYVSTREGKFHFERSGVINASPEKIYPYLSQFKLGSQWSSFEKVDPEMKKSYLGEEGQVGSKLEFDGNSEAGSGTIEILKLVPNESVDLKLTMTKPMHAENFIQYKLTPEANGTRFTWSMHGDNGFMGKLISVFIDCETMLDKPFTDGIHNLKTIVEKENL